MVDTVTSKTLISGKNRLVRKFTNISDGTGETNVVKVDRSTLTGPSRSSVDVPPAAIRIEWVQYSIQGFEGVKITWDDTLSGPADEMAFILSGDGYQQFNDIGGLNPTLDASDLTSAVGDILFSTQGTAAANDTYDITVSMRLDN